MTETEARVLRAVLLELSLTAQQAAACVANTRYRSAKAEDRKKYLRTDADVAVWLGRIDACTARLAADTPEGLRP